MRMVSGCLWYARCDERNRPQPRLLRKKNDAAGSCGAIEHNQIPVTVTVALPVLAPAEAVKVSVDVAPPFAPAA